MTNFSGENLNAACGGPQGGGMDSRRNGVAEISPKYLADVATNGVPVGYKQTEVGEIPEDWQVTTVGKVVSITTGNKNTQDKVVDGLYPFFVRSQQVERINTYSFDGEGVLTAGDGVGTGKIFHHIDGKFDFHQRVYLMYNFGDELDGYYFYIYFSNNFYDRIMSMTAKSSVDSVRREMIADMLMVMPLKAEQTAIANALSDVDALISELEKLIAKKQAIKTATMQQLLTGRTRLPQFALHKDGTPKGTKPSELGEIPEDWVAGYTKELIGKMTSGLSRRLADNDIGMPVLISGNIQNYKLETDNLKYWYKNDPQGANTDDYVLNDGDILLCFINSLSQIGKPCIFRDIGRPTIYTTNLFRIVISDNSNSVFAYYLFSTEYFQKNLQTIAKIAVNQASFTKPDFLNSKIVYPPSKEEQTAIATILSDMDADIQALQQRLDKTRQIKQGMMQELLTGKTRLVKPESAALGAVK
ncbi:restriction endonuclease subunit S [Sessilibacter sp. MAH4]